MVGVLLLATGVLFAVLAGAVVVHRLETTPAASSEAAQGGNAGEKSDQKANPAKSEPAIHGSPTPEPDDSQDKDA